MKLHSNDIRVAARSPRLASRRRRALAVAAGVLVLGLGYAGHALAQAASQVGGLPPREVIGLDSPIVRDAELLDWTVKAVLAPYNVDFYDYRNELDTASRFFTATGWNTFTASYIDQGNLDALKRDRLLCHAQAQRAAVIHSTSYVEGALAYQVQVPIIVTCENVNQVSTNNLLIAARVIRTKRDDHPDGLAIDQLVASKWEGAPG